MVEFISISTQVVEEENSSEPEEPNRKEESLESLVEIHAEQPQEIPEQQYVDEPVQPAEYQQTNIVLGEAPELKDELELYEERDAPLACFERYEKEKAKEFTLRELRSIT